MPRPLHGPPAARRPSVGPGVVAVRLPEVGRPLRSHVAYSGRTPGRMRGLISQLICGTAARRHGSALLPLSSAETQAPSCWCGGRSAPPWPVLGCSPAPRWRNMASLHADAAVGALLLQGPDGTPAVVTGVVPATRARFCKFCGFFFLQCRRFRLSRLLVSRLQVSTNTSHDIQHKPQTCSLFAGHPRRCPAFGLCTPKLQGAL